MIITGLITEYNPFHKGHLHHIQEARRLTQCDVLIIVMSGHFTQRGEPTIVDKWKRTEAALNNGVDIVIELPFIATVQDASRFANHAVNLLNIAGCTHIVFGSESNDLEFMQEIADIAINVDHLKESLKTGMSYPMAYNLIHGPFHPNDILGIAYLKAMKNTKITPLCIQRTNSYHSEDIEENIASASAIRKALLNHQDIKDQSPMKDVLLSSELNTLSNYYSYLRLKLLTSPKNILKEIFLMSEGLENHLINQAKQYEYFDEFMSAAITKRYTRARIQRTLSHLLVHTTKNEVKQLAPINTIRLLGFNQTGQSYLKTLDKEEVKIASRFNQVHEKLRQLEYRATLTYTFGLSEKERVRLLQRELEGPLIIKKEAA